MHISFPSSTCHMSRRTLRPLLTTAATTPNFYDEISLQNYVKVVCSVICIMVFFVGRLLKTSKSERTADGGCGRFLHSCRI